MCDAEERAANGSGLNCCCCAAGLVKVLDGLEDGFGAARLEIELNADGWDAAGADELNMLVI